MMEMTMTRKIEQWAILRGIHEADPAKQVLKLNEEIGELCAGMARGNHEAIRDGLGDIVVVLTILALQLDTSIDECVMLAYDEIKDRKGEMVNGVFVKESDLITK